jgi:hypothetical protein
LKSLDAGINSATANQVRLALHTAAFWLMHGVRAAIPQVAKRFEQIADKIDIDEPRR